MINYEFSCSQCGHSGTEEIDIPKKKWVGLTESEMGQFIHDHCQQTDKTYRSLLEFANKLNNCLIRKNT